jgi:hypothetical protein
VWPCEDISLTWWHPRRLPWKYCQQSQKGKKKYDLQEHVAACGRSLQLLSAAPINSTELLNYMGEKGGNIARHVTLNNFAVSDITL